MKTENLKHLIETFGKDIDGKMSLSCQVVFSYGQMVPGVVGIADESSGLFFLVAPTAAKDGRPNGAAKLFFESESVARVDTQVEESIIKPIFGTDIPRIR